MYAKPHPNVTARREAARRRAEDNLRAANRERILRVANGLRPL